jgi:hypothetical protein
MWLGDQTRPRNRIEKQLQCMYMRANNGHAFRFSKLFDVDEVDGLWPAVSLYGELNSVHIFTSSELSKYFPELASVLT